MVIVILETKHESGEAIRLARLEGDNGEVTGYGVYRGKYDGETGRFRELGKWNRLPVAFDHYSDVIRRMMSLGNS